MQRLGAVPSVGQEIVAVPLARPVFQLRLVAQPLHSKALQQLVHIITAATSATDHAFVAQPGEHDGRRPGHVPGRIQ